MHHSTQLSFEPFLMGFSFHRLCGSRPCRRVLRGLMYGMHFEKLLTMVRETGFIGKINVNNFFL
jgi:hypothetical protein